MALSRLIVHPGALLRGRVRVPGDKSMPDAPCVVGPLHILKSGR